MSNDERFETLEKQIKSLMKMLGGIATLAIAILTSGTAVGVGAYTGAISPESILFPFQISSQINVSK